MEPLTALSVATSVIQFVDFGSKLLSNSRKLYKSADGVLQENLDTEVLTNDLQKLLLGLQRKLPEHRPLPRQSDSSTIRDIENDAALDDLCRRSVEIAEELLRRLDKLKVPSTGPPVPNPPSITSFRKKVLLGGDGSESTLGFRGAVFRGWKSFQRALEASWNRSEIQALSATLREYRSEMEFRILVIFR